MHTHRPGRTLARTRVCIYTHTSIRARYPRVYLVISILLSEQCICLRRRRVFDELQAGAYNARADHYTFFLCICMHIICARGRTDAERNGTERNASHCTGGERPDINTCPSRGFYGLGPTYPRVSEPLTSLTGEYRENLLPKVSLRAFMTRCSLMIPN